MLDLKFIFLAYLLGPVVAIPYGMSYLALPSVNLFFYLSTLYLLALPAIFYFFDLGGHQKIYQTVIIQKICRSCGLKAQEEVKRVEKSGNELIDYFQKRLGHLGFYVAIALFTFLFGIFWASFFSYLLKVKRQRALMAIAVGVLLGNVFWVTVLHYSLPLLSTELLVLLAIAYFLFYGRQRELKILRDLGKRVRKTV